MGYLKNGFSFLSSCWQLLEQKIFTEQIFFQWLKFKHNWKMFSKKFCRCYLIVRDYYGFLLVSFGLIVSNYIISNHKNSLYYLMCQVVSNIIFTSFPLFSNPKPHLEWDLGLSLQLVDVRSSWILLTNCYEC